MTKEEYLRKVAEMQTDISAIKQEGRDDTKTCKGCIHQAVCYRYSPVLPVKYADKCGDYLSYRVIEDIKTDISEYKDDKVIHAERNEMIDIVLGIIDKYTK